MDFSRPIERGEEMEIAQFPYHSWEKGYSLRNETVDEEGGEK